MKVNKSSWHYKLVTGDNERAPTSLCKYVRKLVLLMVGWTIITAILAVCVAGIFTFILAFLPWFYIDTASNPLFAVGIVMFILFAIGILEYISLKFNEKKRERARQAAIDAMNNRVNKKTKIENIEEVKPNIVIEYLRAVKNKICPMLEFVDDDQ